MNNLNIKIDTQTIKKKYRNRIGNKDIILLQVNDNNGIIEYIDIDGTITLIDPIFHDFFFKGATEIR